jgi:ATP-dependent Clp protease ATP-binding subunit ClpC
MDVVAEVDDEQIAEVLAIWTGIPVFKLTEEETARLLRMEDELHKRVIGQEQAIKAVSRRSGAPAPASRTPSAPVARSSSPARPASGRPSCPRRSPSSCSATRTRLILLDMSEYMEKHTVSRLVGSPPGYVGYEEGGQLTEKVRRKPFSVVLFDEVEKAHPDVFNTLLQILEDGRLTDSQGRVVDFKNTVLIMTSNLGTRDISKGFNLGFQKDNDTTGAYERMKSKVQDELKQHFRPEFLNRIDDIVVFHQLAEKEIIQIVDLMLARVDGQLRNKDMGLELTPRPSSCSPTRATTPSSAPARCAAPSSASWRTSCPSRSCSAR